MAKKELKVGDKVRVMDQGLLILDKLRPIGVPPQNIGVVSKILKDGDVLIKFPIGKGHPKNHSQVAPYPSSMCVKI